MRALPLFAMLMLLSVGAAGCASETEGDEEVGETQDQLLAGKRYSEAQIAGLVRAAGFPENKVATMVCTAKWESSFYERASNRNRNGSTDRGLFQVNSIHVGGTRGCPSSGDALFTASTNVKCAYAIYKAQGLNAWYGYRAHKRECDNYRVAGGQSVAPVDDAPTPDADDTNTIVDEESATQCRSATLGTRVAATTCVQSKSNNDWYQCVGGLWYDIGASATSGPGGACGEKFPLGQ
jgi:lysozyme C